MALKGVWEDKVNGKDRIKAEDINTVAKAVIELEETRIPVSDVEPSGSNVWISPSEEAPSGGTLIDVVASVGQVIAVKAVDKDGKPTEYKAVDLPEEVTPDFAADEGEKGHILNRTHYVDKNGVVHKLDNKYIDAEWMATKEVREGDLLIHANIEFENHNTAYLSEYGGGFKVDAGAEFDVYWGDAKYVCALKTHDEEPYIGNGSIALYGAEDTGEPFCLYGSFLAPDTIAYVKKSTNTTETIELKVTTKSSSYYNKLPKEFLPDDVGGVSVTAEVGQTIIVKEVDANGKPTKWESADYQPRTHWTEMTELQPSTTITPFYFEALGVPIGKTAYFDIVIGNKYKVTFDGVEYTCEAFVGSMAGMVAPAFGNAAIAGGENTGEPFAIAMVPGDPTPTVIFFDMNPHTVRVEGEVTVPIPAQYMSNALPHYINATADWDDSNVDNKPTNYTFQQVGSAMDAFNLGRDIKLKLHLNSSNSRMDAIYNLVGYQVVAQGAIYLFVLTVSDYGNTDMVAKAFIGNCPAYLLVVETSDGTLILQTDW